MMTEPALRWTDAHCHLEYSPWQTRDGDAVAAASLEQEVHDAIDAGVVRLIDVGTDEDRSRLAVRHSSMSSAVWATIGLHPHDSSNGWEWIEPMLALLDGPHRVVGVGECGLDYHYDHSPRDLQQSSFVAQIRLAHQFDLALVIHTRNAWADTWAILEDEGTPRRTVFHCFTGGPEEAETCLALHDGVMLSFSGIVSYKSAPENRAAAALCPIDRFTIETDAPYLAPVPHRGKRNVSGFLPHVAQAVAEAKNLSLAEVSEATWHNASRLFSLPDTGPSTQSFSSGSA
jgi:TatD DNase family protein